MASVISVCKEFVEIRISTLLFWSEVGLTLFFYFVTHLRDVPNHPIYTSQDS
jgi:hypothetical protein